MDLTTVMSAIGGIGTLTILQQTIGWYREERRKNSAEDRAQAVAPVAQQSIMLTVADQATVIQQRAIKSLEDQLGQVQLEVGTLRAENAALRQDSAAKERQIARLYTRIGQLEAGANQIDP